MKKYVPTYKTKYQKEIIPALTKEFGYTTVMQVPNIEKIVLNQGVGRHSVVDKKIVDTSIAELSAIAGQKAVATTSRKDISNFKLRKGVPVGVRVTLRSDRMYEFLERLIAVSL
ncbi:MAG: 50S ribosomal protein L5, partial [Sphingobacterium sp.]|uniref:large ribosomal subunit protein uL5 n=1 Tax=Sphingobacterium sp. TaxID=341027 RepID=UPI00284CABEA